MYFEKVPLGEQSTYSLPEPRDELGVGSGSSRGSRGKPAYLVGEHQNLLPLAELHSVLHGGNFFFSFSSCLSASKPLVIMASTWVSAEVGSPSFP